MTNEEIDFQNIGLDAEEDLLFITMRKYKFFMANGQTGRDAMCLYIHYMFTGRLQGTKSVKANRNYCMAGLDMPKARFQAAKNLLLEAKLIENVIRKNESGRVEGHYIKVIFSTSPLFHPVELPPDGKMTTNAYTNNSNALLKKETIEKSDSEKQSVKEKDTLSNDVSLLTYMKNRISEEYRKLYNSDYIHSIKSDMDFRKLYETIDKTTFDGKLNALITRIKNTKNKEFLLTLSAKTLLNKLNDLQIAVEPPKVNNRYKSGNVKTPIKSMTLREQILSTPGLAYKYCLADVIEDEIEKGYTEPSGKKLDCYGEV